MFCAFAGNFQMKNKHGLFLRTGLNNFQTDNLKAHEVHEASEGHAMSSAAKRASERAREERPLPTLPAATVCMYVATLMCNREEVTEIHICCYVSLKEF